MLLLATALTASPNPPLAAVLRELGSFNARPVENVEPRIAHEAPTP